MHAKPYIPSKSDFLNLAAFSLFLGASINSSGGDGANESSALEIKEFKLRTDNKVELKLSRAPTGNSVLQISEGTLDNWKALVNLNSNSTSAILNKGSNADNVFYRVAEKIPAPVIASQVEQKTCNSQNECLTRIIVYLDKDSFEKYPPATWEVTLKSVTPGGGELNGYVVGLPVANYFRWEIAGDHLGQWTASINKKL